VRKRLARLSMGNEDGRDFIVEEGACTVVSQLCRPNNNQDNNSPGTVLYLYPLICVASLARCEVALKVRDAILVRVDEPTIQSAELGGYDLEEVLVHVLRF
jgi:hypothetical protein